MVEPSLLPVPTADRHRHLQALRQRLRGLVSNDASARPVPVIPTGLASLDALLLGGGLPRGRLTLISGQGGATGLLHQIAAQATRAGTVAWLDPTAVLYPPALAAAGADLAEVMLIRDATGPRIGRAAATLLRTGAVDLLVCDLPSADQRLTNLAHHGTTAVVLGRPAPAWAGSAADLWLHVRRDGRRVDLAGLTGYQALVTVRRQRGGREGGQASITIAYPLPLPAIADLDRAIARSPTHLPLASGQANG